LSHHGCVPRELPVGLLVSLLDRERHFGVDSIQGTRAIGIRRLVEQDIYVALPTSITVAIFPVRVGRIAFVTYCTEGVLVSLHDVELGAPVASNLVGIAILERIAVVVDSRHENRVECCETSTADFAQINIELDATTEKIGLKIALRVNVIDSR